MNGEFRARHRSEYDENDENKMSSRSDLGQEKGDRNNINKPKWLRLRLTHIFVGIFGTKFLARFFVCGACAVCLEFQ